MAASTSPGSPTLLLFPTELEHLRFRDQGGVAPGLCLRAVVGFGPVAAAVRTSQLITSLRPGRVLLLGIAGTFDAGRDPVGSALTFTSVAVDGIGAGQGKAFQGPRALGFPQWPGSPDTTSFAVQDALSLAAPPNTPKALLLTTCAASDSDEHASQRLTRFPTATAEDMEGFAVALSCAMAGVPCAIVRGISNLVGDRDPGHWRIPGALAAARRLALEVLAAPHWEPAADPAVESAP